jgi:transposase
VVFKRRVGNDLGVIVAALAPYGGALSGMVVESTSNWYWRVDGPMAAGFEVDLANPAAIHRYSGLKHTDDGDDAAWRRRSARRSVFPRRLDPDR